MIYNEYMSIFLPNEEQTVSFANKEKSKVRIGGKDRDVVFGPWEKGPDPEHPDDCHFRPFTYVGTNKEYTDGGEIDVLHRTPYSF